MDSAQFQALLTTLLYDVRTYLVAALDFAIIVIASAHVVLTKRDNRSALGWVAIIWLTPIVGVLLYFFFGVNRIFRTAERLRRRVGEHPAIARQDHCTQDDLHRVLEDDALHLTTLAGYVGRVAKSPLLDGNRVEPLHGGDEAYDAMLAAIASAQHSIGLETYIFDNDPTGRQFVDALGAAVRRGVEVRVLIDSVGSRYTFPTIRSRLRAAGVPEAAFLPTLIPGKWRYSNLRCHRKLLIVDGKVGFTGGMNIREGHRKQPGAPHPVEDLHFRLEGPVVGQLLETFVLDWKFAAGEWLSGAAWFPQLAPVGESLCRAIPDGPYQNSDRVRMTLQGAINCSRSSLTIVTPYFLPDSSLISALNVASLRGVEVNILIPEKNNLALVQWACTAQLWQVLIRGCKVWLTPPPFDHTKLVLVDDAWVFFGSANWDPRSLRLNFELNVECYDRRLASELGAAMHEKRSRSKPLTLADVDGRPLLIRLRDGIARLATPYL